MSRVAVYLARFAVITLGFACAALAASAFFHLLMLGGVGPLDEDARDLTFYALLVSVPVVALLIAYSAFLPAFAYFLVAEIAGWRRWPIHALAGGGAAAAAIYLRDGRLELSDSPSVDLVLLVIACGMVGGLAYWAVAGRHAGRWLHGGAHHGEP